MEGTWSYRITEGRKEMQGVRHTDRAGGGITGAVGRSYPWFGADDISGSVTGAGDGSVGINYIAWETSNQHFFPAYNSKQRDTLTPSCYYFFLNQKEQPLSSFLLLCMTVWRFHFITLDCMRRHGVQQTVSDSTSRVRNLILTKHSEPCTSSPSQVHGQSAQL